MCICGGLLDCMAIFYFPKYLQSKVQGLISTQGFQENR